MTQSFTQVKIGLPLPSSHFGRFSPTKGGFPVWWLLLAGRRSGDARPATWMTRKLSASTGESPPPLSAGRCHLPRENCILAFSPYLIPSDLLGQLSNQPCMNRRSTGDKNLNPASHLQSSQSLQQPVNLSQNFSGLFFLFLHTSSFTSPLCQGIQSHIFSQLSRLKKPPVSIHPLN